MYKSGLLVINSTNVLHADYYCEAFMMKNALKHTFNLKYTLIHVFVQDV